MLRAYLADDWRRLVRAALRGIAIDPLSVHLSLLVQRAFRDLTRRAFPPGSTMQDVRRFVDRCPELDSGLRNLDARLAMELLLAALAHRPEPTEPGRTRRFLLRLGLLRALVAELGLDETDVKRLIDGAAARSAQALRRER